MADDVTLFARKLREYRAVNGQHGRMTQEGLAELLGVSVDAIGKYERSVSFIRGDLEHRLLERLGWTREEVLACREDWDILHQKRPGSGYSVLDDAMVDEHFDGSWRDACRASIVFADVELPDLPPELAANEKVFLPIYETYRDCWAAIMFEGQIVAKWSLPFLLPEDVALFRSGQLLESQLSVERIHQPILPGKYYGYCPVLAVRSGHEASSSLLLTTFVNYLEKLAERNIVLSGLGTVTVSPGGAQICKELGLNHIGDHCLNPAFGIWELTGAAVPNSIFGRRSLLVRNCYTAAFR